MSTTVGKTGLKEWLSSREISFKCDVNLAAKSHIKAGGIADLMILPATCEEVKDVISELKNIGNDYKVIGGLSNVLFRDGRIKTPILSLANLKKISLDSNGVFVAEAGVMMPTLAQKAARQGFSGLAGLVGVPGSVGGGVFMNASCYGSCISEYLLDVLCVDRCGELKVLSKLTLNYQWRRSAFHDAFSGYTILSARFSLPKGDTDVELGLVKEISLHRKTYQEKNLPNLGSLFATVDIYTDLSKRFFFYKLFLMLVRILCRFSPKKRRDKVYAAIMRRLTLVYFKLADSPNVGFSKSTFNCVVNRGDATANQIIEQIERAHKAIDFCVPLENEIIKDIL